MKILTAALLSFLSIAQLVTAHPTGHSEETVQTVQHVLTEPDHLLVIGLLSLIIGAIAYKFLRSSARASKR